MSLGTIGDHLSRRGRSVVQGELKYNLIEALIEETLLGHGVLRQRLQGTGDARRKLRIK